MNIELLAVVDPAKKDTGDCNCYIFTLCERDFEDSAFQHICEQLIGIARFTFSKADMKKDFF